MEFIVTRSSDFLSKKQPIEGAYQKEITRIDVRNISDPSGFKNQRLIDEWYNAGTNHRVINGKIARDMGTEKVWVVNINTLEELMNFKEKCGEDIIITTSYIDYATPEIEIYDSYRE